MQRAPRPSRPPALPLLLHAGPSLCRLPPADAQFCAVQARHRGADAAAPLAALRGGPTRGGGAAQPPLSGAPAAEAAQPRAEPQPEPVGQTQQVGAPLSFCCHSSHCCRCCTRERWQGRGVGRAGRHRRRVAARPPTRPHERRSAPGSLPSVPQTPRVACAVPPLPALPQCACRAGREDGAAWVWPSACAPGSQPGQQLASQVEGARPPPLAHSTPHLAPPFSPASCRPPFPDRRRCPPHHCCAGHRRPRRRPATDTTRPRPARPRGPAASSSRSLQQRRAASSSSSPSRSEAAATRQQAPLRRRRPRL